jgi:NAD(P)-dependent dehydrogenase (short-subunit alcohol dehydrogenase family)
VLGELLERGVEDAIDADGGLDVLVNNAGVEGRTPDNDRARRTHRRVVRR